MQLKISNKLSFQPELLYYKSGFNHVQSFSITAGSYFKGNTEFVYFPISALIKYNLPLKNASVFGGLSYAQLNYATDYSSSYPSGSQDVIDSYTNGVDGVVGIDYFLSFGLGCMLRYHHALSNIYSQPTVSGVTQSLKINTWALGLQFRF